MSAVTYGSERVQRGAGGETHQIADEGRPPLTTQQGVVVADDQNTLRAGERGPAALEDFHFREKIFHFDHERIPERVASLLDKGFISLDESDPAEFLAQCASLRFWPRLNGGG